MALWDKLFGKKDEDPRKLNPIVQRSPAPAPPTRVSGARPAVRPEPYPVAPAPAPKPALPALPQVSAEASAPQEKATRSRKKGDEGGTKSRSAASDDQVLVKRGLKRQSQGDHEGAIQDFTKAIELNPNCAQAYASRGVSREARGDGGGAKSDYSKSIQIEIMGEISRQIRDNPDVEV